jgi:hypothetical protein
MPQNALDRLRVEEKDLREIIYEERHRIIYRVDSDRIVGLSVQLSPLPLTPDALQDIE